MGKEWVLGRWSNQSAAIATSLTRTAHLRSPHVAFCPLCSSGDLVRVEVVLEVCEVNASMSIGNMQCDHRTRCTRSRILEVSRETASIINSGLVVGSPSPGADQSYCVSLISIIKGPLTCKPHFIDYDILHFLLFSITHSLRHRDASLSVRFSRRNHFMQCAELLFSSSTTCDSFSREVALFEHMAAGR